MPIFIKAKDSRVKTMNESRMRNKDLCRLPDQIYEDFHGSICEFANAKRKKYRELVTQFNQLKGADRSTQFQGHLDELTVLDDEVDDFVDGRINDFFQYVGTEVFKDHLLFSLPLEVQREVARYMDPSALFSTVFLSTKLFSLLQGDKRMVMDTVTVDFFSHHIYRIHTRMRKGTEYPTERIQVVSRISWRATPSKSTLVQSRPRSCGPQANRLPTISLPARPTLPCLLKNVIPATTVRYLRLRPRFQDLANQQKFFTHAFDTAKFFDNPTVIVTLTRSLTNVDFDTIIESRHRMRLVVPDTFPHDARFTYGTFAYDLRPSDLLVTLERIRDFDDPEPVQNISIDPEYSDEDVWRMYERWTNNDITMKFAYVQIADLDRYAALEQRIISSVLNKGYERDFARERDCCYVSRNVPDDTTNFVYSREAQFFHVIANGSAGA